MGVLVIGVLSVMIWHAIFIGIIKCVRNIENKIDRFVFLCQYLFMLKKTFSLLLKKSEPQSVKLETDNRCKHVSLTHFLKRKWVSNVEYLQEIVSKCNVSTDLGVLPPGLCRHAVNKDIAETSKQFRVLLNEFLEKKYTDILNVKSKKKYVLMPIGRLFGTECVLDVVKCADDGISFHYGLSGVVGKLIFPQLDQEYALKIFFNKNLNVHGVWHEVANAFASYNAEPKNYFDIYMASIGTYSYMLSAWGGDKIDFIDVKKNKNVIFQLSELEMSYRNIRRGRIIDWGGVEQTDYGMASYRVRKLYRVLMWAAEHNDRKTIDAICARYSKLKSPVKRDMGDVIVLLFYDALDGKVMSEVLLNIIKQNANKTM